MLSVVVVGFIRVGAVALAAGGLGAAVYFVADNGSDDSNDSLQTPATTTLEAPQPLTPPTATATATVVLGPTPTAAGIDTSDWKTYESPHGFTLKYPPEWVLETYEDVGLQRGFVKILNVGRQNTVSRMRDLGQMEGGESGDAWIEVAPGVLPRTVEERMAQCGGGLETPVPEGSTFVVRRETIGGLPAVVCGGSSPDTYDPLQKQVFFGEGYFLVLPQDQPLDLIGYAVDPDAGTLDTLRAIILTLELTP